MTLTDRLNLAYQPLKDAAVVGFSSLASALVIYTGSFLWMLLLLGADAWSLSTGDFGHRTILSVLLGLNAFAFVLQTWDVLFLHFHLWMVTALNWMAQLSAIGLASSLLGRAEGNMEVSYGVLRVVAQCLFTGSQFGVTLEYLWRRSAAMPVIIAATTAARPRAWR